MRGTWFKALAGVIVVAAVQTAPAQVRSLDAERLLVDRFGFTPAEVSQARSGQTVAKLLPAAGSSDVGVLAAVRIDGDPGRLVTWLRDITRFRNDADLGISRRLSDPPRIADFADLSLDASDLDSLRTCRPGKCDLRLGAVAIARFQKEVDWKAADAAARANALMRQLLLGYAQAYLKGGDAALGAAHNEKAARAVADEFHQVLWQSKAMYDIAPALATYLEDFPAARLPESEQFLYWSKATLGSDATIALHQLVIYHLAGGEAFVVDKQLYASRYVDAALTVISTASTPTGTGFYALAGARARSTTLSSISARMLRGVVERATRDTATMYLNWLRASLML